VSICQIECSGTVRAERTFFMVTGTISHPHPTRLALDHHVVRHYRRIKLGANGRPTRAFPRNRIIRCNLWMTLDEKLAIKPVSSGIGKDGRLTMTTEAEQRCLEQRCLEQRCLEQEAVSRSRKEDSEVNDRRLSKPEY
jgi:hypothetical protein